ncbi:Methionine adenosyltransferase 2 subunit beta [Armadillidium vulgare]|nr:Methionine adenosyltransferase 2 subunit beta [Armadillidium vulgare]
MDLEYLSLLFNFETRWVYSVFINFYKLYLILYFIFACLVTCNSLKMSENVKIFITGASGLLGRQIFEEATAQKFTVIGTAYSRVKNNLIKCNLTTPGEVEKLIEEIRPNYIVHAAAERFPDKVEKDFESAKLLNVATSGRLAKIAKQGGKALILRIPILYGPVESLDESAVSCLLPLLLSEKEKSVSDYEKRYPSHTRDIARIICDLIKVNEQGTSVSGIYQWSGKEQLTKYGMLKAMAEVFSLPFEHIKPDRNPSPGAPRPYDALMDNSKLENLQISHHIDFKSGIKECLKNWIRWC